MKGLLLVFTILTSLSLVSTKTSLSGNTITNTQPLTHNQTLVSSDERFVLGFFTPDKSNRWYLGVWYMKIPNHTAVWVANRDNPLLDSSGVLEINGSGSLVLRNRTHSAIWSSLNHTGVQNPIAQLMDSGNLVLKYQGEDDPGSFIWQSFDHPTDTLIAGMKLGWDITKGLDSQLTSWKSREDPSAGEYTAVIDPHGYPQLFILKGSVKEFRTGSWNGLGFSDFFVETLNDQQVYYTFNSGTDGAISRLVLVPSGSLQRFVWNDQRQEWNLMLTMPQDRCDTFQLCGTYATCNINKAIICECLTGFTPKSPQAWDQLDWSDGCKRRVKLNCNNGDGFVKYASVKLPNTSVALVNKSMTSEECGAECLNNCSCMAYSNSDIAGKGIGCLMWFGDLIDIRVFNENGQELYVRMAASEIEVYAASHKSKKSIIVIILVSLASGGLLLGSIISYFTCKSRMKQRGDEQNRRANLDLPLFEYRTIATATNNFSGANKLGEGGFGPVYKGILPTGQEIAVKRLSQKSGQGLDEFKNEVILIAKLQHRNLVRLLGCCIEREENMLIYEFMHNNSLNSLLFDQTRSMLLDWERRFNIVLGIAHGLLYLHRDSRLRIIHRDLKASNILLDNKMNPKISDFGMARMFRSDQIEADTGKVVGTYGYMSPEYVIDGRFSMKSDVFSFGVMVLEIVSGKKNTGFYHPDHQLNLLGQAWKLWNKSKALELVDASMGNLPRSSEVLRVIQVGLLCVQQHPKDRPNMSSVVLMLCNERAILPKPKQPAFYTETYLTEEGSSSSGKSCVLRT